MMNRVARGTHNYYQHVISIGMDSRQRETLKAILECPTRADIRWTRVESLLAALGVEFEGQGGSRIGVILREHRIVLHLPNPHPCIKKWAVETVRGFLASMEVKP